MQGNHALQILVQVLQGVLSVAAVLEILIPQPARGIVALVVSAIQKGVEDIQGHLAVSAAVAPEVPKV